MYTHRGKKLKGYQRQSAKREGRAGGNRVERCLARYPHLRTLLPGSGGRRAEPDSWDTAATGPRREAAGGLANPRRRWRPKLLVSDLLASPKAAHVEVGRPRFQRVAGQPGFWGLFRPSFLGGRGGGFNWPFLSLGTEQNCRLTIL